MRLDDDVTRDSRMFHVFAATTGKVQPPIVEQQTRGTMSSAIDLERRHCRPSVSAMRGKSRARYGGAIPLRHL